MMQEQSKVANPALNEAIKAVGFITPFIRAWSKNKKSPTFVDDQRKELAKWDKSHNVAGTSGEWALLNNDRH
jgi:hypothetical protein